MILYQVVVLLILNLCSGVVQMVFCVGIGSVGGVRGVMWGSWGFGWNYCRKWCFVCELVEVRGLVSCA